MPKIVSTMLCINFDLSQEEEEDRKVSKMF